MKFEGEYLNRKIRNGRGFNKNNKIGYEIKEGKGFVIEYNNYGSVIFEGEYKNGDITEKNFLKIK